MNQNICCEECSRMRNIEELCYNKNCPCHTSPKEEIVNDWEIKRQISNRIDRLVECDDITIKILEKEQIFKDIDIILSSTEKRVSQDIIKMIKEKGLHLGYANDIISKIKSKYE